AATQSKQIEIGCFIPYRENPASFNTLRCRSCQALRFTTLISFRHTDNSDAPWSAPDFDPLQFFARFYIDYRHVVRSAIRGVKLRAIRVERDPPGAVSNWNCCRDSILLRVD